MSERQVSEMQRQGTILKDYVILEVSSSGKNLSTEVKNYTNNGYVLCGSLTVVPFTISGSTMYTKYYQPMCLWEK